MINGECHCSTQMHMLAITALLMFGFSTWNFTVLWRAGGCPLNENSPFASLEKYKLTNSYPVGVKELNCPCVINDWIIVRWYEKATIYYISTNWLLAQLVPKEWAVTTKTCSFFVRWFIKLKKELNKFPIKQQHQEFIGHIGESKSLIRVYGTCFDAGYVIYRIYEVHTVNAHKGGSFRPSAFSQQIFCSEV